MKKLTLLVFLLLLCFTSVSNAGYYVTPFPGTIESIDRNPALLGESDYSFELQLNPANLAIWNNSWTAFQIADNLNAYLDQTRKDDILSSLGEDALILSTKVDSNLALGGGSWGLRSGLQLNSSLSIDREVFELILEGTDLDLELDLAHTDFRANLMMDTAVAKSFELSNLADRLDWDSFYLGTGFHYLSGLALLEAEANGDVKLRFDEDETSLAGEGSLTTYNSTILDDGGGRGFALDLGIWGRPTQNLGLGLSLNNLGFMTWDNVHKLKYEGNFDYKHPLMEDVNEEDWEDEYEKVVDENIGSLTDNTPISLETEIHYKVNSRLELAGGVGYHQAPESNIGFLAASRFYLPRFIPLTLMADYNTYQQQPLFSADLGLRFFNWEVINLFVKDINMISGHTEKWSVGVSTAIRF